MIRKLPPGVRGGAHFIDEGKRRLWLSRWWHRAECPLSGFWLWLGMNPSTAGANIDDPTVSKETLITIRNGGSAYVKCNVMDWIATDQRELPAISNPTSIFNMSCITDYAYRAERIVCAWGSLHHKLRHHAQEVLTCLLENRYELWCLGTTKDGSPKHPLYLRNDTKLIRYQPDRPPGA